MQMDGLLPHFCIVPMIASGAALIVKWMILTEIQD